MSWQPYNQQGTNELLDAMGSELSLKINCGVRYVGAFYNKPGFECHCSIPFPEFVVKAAYESGNWEDIISHHNFC